MFYLTSVLISEKKGTFVVIFGGYTSKNDNKKRNYSAAPGCQLRIAAFGSLRRFFCEF